MPIYLKTAESAAEKDAVYRLRHQVFVKEERRFDHPSDRIFDLYDTLEENINLIALEKGRVVGSLRLTVDNPMGMPALEHYDFRPLMQRHAGRYGCIGWLCISEGFRRHRGMLMGLFKLMVRESRKRGVRHLIAPLHPPVLPMLMRLGAKAVDAAFFSEKLNVEIVPIHLDFNHLPPVFRETVTDPTAMLFDDSNERRIYRQGETIVEKGTSGTEAFVIMRGTVEVLVHTEVQNRMGAHSEENGKPAEKNPLLGSGQVFGELALLDGAPRAATVVCHSKEVDLMVWSRAQFLEQLEMNNQKAIELCKILARRLRMEAAGHDPDRAYETLVASLIMDVSLQASETVNMAWLAGQCGLHARQMQKLVTRWTEEGVVCCEDTRTIRIRDLDRLRQKLDCQFG